MNSLLRKASSCRLSVCSSRSSNDSGDAWHKKDLPHKTYKQMTSPSTHEAALKLLKSELWEWGAIMQEILSGEFEGCRPLTFLQTIKETFEHKRGWLSRVAARGDEYARRRDIVRRGLEILANKDPRFTRTASIILEYATREEPKVTPSETETAARQVTTDEWSSSLLDHTAGYGHYFHRTEKAGERPELWTISKDGMYMKWTKEGQGCPDMAKGGRSRSKVWGWTRTDEPVGTLLGGEPRGVYEGDSDDEERVQRERELRKQGKQGKQAATDAQTSDSPYSSGRPGYQAPSSSAGRAEKRKRIRIPADWREKFGMEAGYVYSSPEENSEQTTGEPNPFMLTAAAAALQALPPGDAGAAETERQSSRQ